jgi:hypothetical protein
LRGLGIRVAPFERPNDWSIALLERFKPQALEIRLIGSDDRIPAVVRGGNKQSCGAMAVSIGRGGIAPRTQARQSGVITEIQSAQIKSGRLQI